jgi:hypothetical protein
LFFLQGITESTSRAFFLGREEWKRIVDESKDERGHLRMTLLGVSFLCFIS